MSEATLSEAQPRSFCAEYSRAAGEQLSGTVKVVDLWLMIEYRGRWERDALLSLPDNAREQMDLVRLDFPRVRAALIRQPTRNSGPLNVFWAFSREADAQLFHAEFDDYSELLLDPKNLPKPSGEELFAVCTHGTHDLCCAQFGNKIYSSLKANTANAWQISHIGGCRFAPNVVHLPHGFVYGRVDPDECALLVSGNVLAEKLRGRSCYPKPVQAAEQFLRAERKLTGLNSVRLVRTEQAGTRNWLVTFMTADSATHTISVIIESDSVTTYKSCSVSDLLPRETFVCCLTATNRGESNYGL